MKTKLFPSEEQSAPGAEETKAIGQEKIIFTLLVSYVVIVILAIITGRFLGHTEESEWLIYEISSIVIFLLVAILGLFKKITNNSYFNKIIKLSPKTGLILFVTQILFLTFYSHVINYGYLSLILVGVIASLLFYKKSSESLIQSLLVNSVLLFCVEGYFFEYFDQFKIQEYMLVLISWLILSLSLIFFRISRVKISSSFNKVMSVAVLLIVIFVAFNSTRRFIDYWHYSFFIGPAYDLNLGKSLLSDIPSLYGYLPIHFISLVLKPFGINFENFHLLNTTLFFLYYLGFYFAYKKIFKDNLFTGLFSLVTTLINTRFESGALPPSSGPIRHGISLLMILALLYLPQKINFWVTSLLAAMTIFWSPEVAIYVVPAFLFISLIKTIIQGKKPSKILTSLITSLIPFAMFTAGIFFWIILKEYGYHRAFPNFSDYFQFVSLYKNTPMNNWLNMQAPIFGNYYLAVLTLIVGLCFVFFQEWDLSKNKLLIPLSFLAIYNMAIFSYFVSTSLPITLNNIFPFILLELAIVFQYFRKNRSFWSKIFLPGTLFLTTFMIICTWNVLNILPGKEDPHYANVKTLLDDYQIIKKTYGLTSENVLILSKFYDTLIITTEQIKTTLPLNPSALTILIPNYIEKYLTPNLDKVKSGTILVYTEDLPPEFSDFLNKNYIFEEINPQKRIGIFRIYNFKPR